jgi:hypothetical protein
MAEIPVRRSVLRTLAKADMKRAPRMKGMTLVVILMVAVVAAGALTISSIYINGSSTKTATLTGILSVYVGGAYSGQNTNSASYNVSLISKAGIGTMNLTQISGSDLVPMHQYSLTDVVVSPYNLTMLVSGSNVSLGWINNSTVWRELNGSWAAASGPNAPVNETIGAVNSSVFHLPTNYYFVFGLTVPAQPTDNIPFVIAPALFARTPVAR